MPIEIHQLTINSHLGDTEKKTSGTKETIADTGGASSKKDKESGDGVSVRELNRYLADFKQDLLEEWRRSMRNYLEERRDR